MCMALLSRHRTGGVHMRANWSFSTNDVLANVGVIAAGALVAWSGSNLPDLVIGSAIAEPAMCQLSDCPAGPAGRRDCRSAPRHGVIQAKSLLQVRFAP